MGREPLSRIEKILSNIVGEGSYELDPPLSDTEEILIAILNDETIDIDARDRFCTILLCILNGEEYTGVTMSRAEEILKCISEGEKYEVDEWTYENHLSRIEQLLTDWANAEDPEYSKTVAGTIIHVLDAVEKPAESLVVTMQPSQEATPFIDATTREPYLSKTASTTGNKRYLDKIVGGTVCWNQLAPLDVSKWTIKPSVTLTLNDNEYEIKSATNSNVNKASTFGNAIANHVYFYTASLKSDNDTIRIAFGFYESNGSAVAKIDTVSANNFETLSSIYKATSNYEMTLRVPLSTASGSGGKAKNIQVVDLTKLFSNAPAIADYIYSLEQATAGAGVQWLKDHGFIDDLYRAYNAGELISAKPTAFTVGGDTYALGGVDLRGLFKLDSNNNLYCEGDELTPDRQISDRYKIIDLGSYDWSFGESTSSWYTPLNDAVGYYSTNGITQICSKYLSYPPNTSWVDADKFCAFGSANKNFCIKDLSLVGYTPEQIKTYLTGTMLLYKIETPTTSASTPYTNPAPISNGDTESFTDTRAVPIPVGNESHYAGEYEITGNSSVNVYHAGGSMFDANDLQKWNPTTNITITVNDTTSFNLKATSVNYSSTRLSTITQVQSGDSFLLKFKMKVNSSTSSRITTGFRNIDTDSMISNTSISISSNNFVIGEWVEYSRLIHITDNLNASLSIVITWNNKPSSNVDFKDFEVVKATRTYPVTFTSQGTVYGGTVDLVSGELSVTWSEIASYAGETLPGRWYSSMDEYAVGSTPSTGAQVVYELSEPLTYQLTPTEINMLLNENYFWEKDGKSLELTYLGSNPAMMMQAMRAQNNLLKKQGLPTIAIKPKDPIVIKDPIVTPIKPKL